MSLLLTKPDDSELTGITLTVERAVPSATVSLKILNDGLVAVTGAFVTMYAEDSPGSGTYVSSGQPVVDELMGRFEITGQDSSATPGQEVLLGRVQPMGHLAVALLPPIFPGDWLLADFWLDQAGSSAAGGSINIKLEVANERSAYPLPFGVSSVGTGIDTGKKQPRSFLIDGRETTATGTPDDYVHVSVGSWLLAGEEYADASIEDLQFDQNDNAAVALASGESYYAVVTQGIDALPNVTKGLLGTSPTKPTPPDGELILAFVKIRYNASLTNIVAGDIDLDDLVYGRYLVTAPVTGLTATVHHGEAVIADFRQVHDLDEDVTLDAGATNRIWLEWDGSLTVTTSDIPPSAGAVKLATAVTDGSSVTSLTDTRTYIQRSAPGALEVKELDGAPDVVDVVTLRVPNGSLTDLGSGVVELAFPAITGKVDDTLSVTATEGVQRTSGTDLTEAAEFKLDINGLTDLAELPDNTDDWFALYDVSAGDHKKVLGGYLGGQDYRSDFAGDGVTQPATLSPVPKPGCVVMVFKDGLLAVPGAVDYTDDGVGNIVYTPVLVLGQTGTILWRA